MTLIQNEPKKIYIRVDVQPITTAGIYHNSDLGLISLSSDGTNWITIADKNLGATSTDVSSSSSYGNYYQRGNNYGFPRTGSVSTSTTKVSINGYGPGNYYSSSTFIKQYDRMSDYSSANNRSNLRGYTTGTVEAMKGPCDTGYHIPTPTEIDTLNTVKTALSLTSAKLKQYLKLPVAKGRNYSDASVTSDLYYYWTCQYTDTNKGGYAFFYDLSSSATPFVGYGLPIRPFANTATQPDDSWTRLDV